MNGGKWVVVWFVGCAIDPNLPLAGKHEFNSSVWPPSLSARTPCDGDGHVRIGISVISSSGISRSKHLITIITHRAVVVVV